MNSNVVTVTLNPALDKTVVIPRLDVGGLNRVQKLRVDPGGKGINVARVLNKFGINTTATGLLAGSQGQLLLNYLNLEKIPADFLTIPGETRTNLKIVDDSSNVTTEINEAGFEVATADMNTFTAKLSTMLETAACLVLSGSLPPQVEPAIYRQFIELANRSGVKVILDADDEALAEGIQAVPFAIKPNIHELEQLTGCKMADERDIVRACQRLLDQGIQIIIVSMGAQGAIVMNCLEAYRVKVGAIIPQSTVGAGDSMVGALVYSLLSQHSLAETARWAVAAGTVTALKSGTQVCSLQEVEQFLNQVSIEKIE
jgi:1-phosphofructokinase